MKHGFKVMVCITQQKTCERLIKKASKINFEKGGELFVIHVAKNEWNFLDNIKEGEALEYLFSISKSVGANLCVLKSDNIVKSIADFAKEHEIKCIIMGEPQNDHKENNFFKELKELLTDVDLRVVAQDDI